MKFFKKDANIQNEISLTIDKYNKDSFSTRSQIGRNDLIQNKVFIYFISFHYLKLYLLWVKQYRIWT